MVEMCRAPRILELLVLTSNTILFIHVLFIVTIAVVREVMQQPRLARATATNHLFEIAWLIAVDFSLGVTVTGARDQDGDVDDQSDQSLGRVSEPRDIGIRRPETGGRVLGEVGELIKIILMCVAVVSCAFGSLRGECAVDVETTLFVIDDARSQCLLAVAPSNQIFGFFVRQGLEFLGRERRQS